MEKTLGASMIVCLMLVGSMIVLTMQAEGTEPLYRSNIRVVTDPVQDDFDQLPLDIKSDRSGRLYIAYQSNYKFYNDVYMAHSDDEGETWSTHFRVDDTLWDGNDTNDKSNQGRPSLAIASNGTVYVAWNDKRDTRSSTQIRIAWSHDGENFTRSIRIDPFRDVVNWDASEPRLAINETGHMVSVWRDKLFDGSYFNIWGSYSTDDGVTWAYPVKINTDPYFNRDHRNMRMAMHGPNVYVTWEDNRGDSTYRPYLAVSVDGGRTYGAEKAISDDEELENDRGSAWPAVDDAGNLYIVWRDGRSGKDEIWFTKSTDNGNTLSPNVKVSKVPEHTQADLNPAMICDGDGLINVIYQRERPTAGKTDEGDLFYIGSEDGGATWTDPIRVDDTDRFKTTDNTYQTDPVIGLDIHGAVISAWRDGRNFQSSQTDIYFSRHSGLPSIPNRPPEIREMVAFSPFVKNPHITSADALTTFSFTHLDHNNDRPAAGYPKAIVYKDPVGSDVLVGPLTMTMDDESDFDLMDGSIYSIKVKLNTTGFVYWRVIDADERAPGVEMRSEVVKGPLVDAAPPTVEVLEPNTLEWITDPQVEVRARVTDTGGAGIDDLTIKVRKALNGLESLETGSGVRIKNVQRIDNDTYEAWGVVSLDDGDDNFIVIEAFDNVANGPGASDPVNVWVDAEGPYFTDIRPHGDVQNMYEMVNCSVVWMDHVPGSRFIVTSGVDISSIKYCYRTTSGPLSDWMEPDGVIDLGNGEFRAYVNLRFFDDGFYNFIKWKAQDHLGQGRETGEMRVTVRVPDNYPPQFRDARSYPPAVVSQTPHLFWEDASDEEGDTLFYSVMILTYPYRLYMFTKPVGIGQRTFFDVPNSARLEPGYYILQVNVTDNIGGYDIKEWIFRVLETGTPPPEDVPTIDPIFVGSPEETIGWDRSASDGALNVTYMVRIGTGRFEGDIKEWTDIGPDPELSLSEVGLDLGIYSLQVMAHNNGNYSRVTETMLKLNDYDIEGLAPGRYTAYKGKATLKLDPLRINLTNMATYGDNATVRISGEIVDKGWAYLALSSRDVLYPLELPSQKVLTLRTATRVSIIVYPPSGADGGDFPLKVEVFSEDGTLQFEATVNVTVTDRPSESIIREVTNTIYDFLIYLFPFLESIPKDLLLPLFFLIVTVIIIVIVAIFTKIYRVKARKRKRTDPYAEHKRLYKEMYGVEPSKETLDRMVSEGGLPSLDLGAEQGVRTTEFDESFLESEKGKAPAPPQDQDVDATGPGGPPEE